MKILALETLFKKNKNAKTGEVTTTHSGVDYARVVNPMTALGKEKGFETTIMWDYPMEVKDLNKWDDLVKDYDTVYTSYIDNSLLYVAIRLSCKKHGKKFVIDLDDNIWAVSKSHPDYENYKMEYDPLGKPRYAEALFKRTVILGDADYVTCTNQRLKNAIVSYAKQKHENIHVFPNYIDLSGYDYKKIKPKESKEIVISYTGGGSHMADITNPEFTGAIQEILKKYDNTVFVTNGFYMPALKDIFQNRYRYRPGYADVTKYIDILWPEASAEANVVVAPLEHTSYSRCKSYIKFLEMGAAKLPGVYEKIEPYTEIVDGENGLLASGNQEWIEKLSLLIESEELRRSMGEKAYETTYKHQIQDNLQGYKDFFSKIA